MSTVSDKLLAYKVARSYYVDNIPQNQIAKILGISPPQISRLLQKAKEYGIVQISVIPPEINDFEELKERFLNLTGIKELVIADVPQGQLDDEEAIRNSIYYVAAGYLPKLIYQAKLIGVGWGKTIYKTVLAMDHSMQPADACFFPLIGSAGSYSPAFQTNSIVDRLAEKFKAQGLFINAPAFGLNADKLASLDKDTIHPVLKAWESLDLVIFGLGSPWKDSYKELKQEFGEEVSEKLILQRNAGNIVGHFFDENGNYNLTDYDKKILTIPIDKLLSAKRRVCISGGAGKEKGILVGCKMKLFDTLITDKSTVLYILENYEDVSL